MSETPSGSAPPALPRRPLLILFFAVFTMAVNMSFVYAVLPAIGREIGLTALQISFVVTPAALVFVFANAIWGFLSDGIGRKFVIGAALAGATLAALAFGWIIDARLGGTISVGAAVIAMVASRIALGALAGGLLPATQAYVADSTDTEARTRAYAVIGSGFGAGMVTGPGFAAATAGFGASFPFFAVGTLAAAATLVVVATLGEPPHSKRAALASRGRTGFAQLWALLATLCLANSANGILLQVTGFRMQDQFALAGPEAARLAGIALMVQAAGLIATQIGIARSRLSTRSSRALLLVGLGAAFTGMALVGLVDAYGAQLAAMALFGMGLGTVQPSVLGMITVVAEKAGDQGRVGGFSGASQGFGMVLGPLAGAAAYGFASGAPYAIGVGLLVCVAALVVFAIPRLR